MGTSSVYVGKVFGIPIRVHASWLLVFLLVTFSLATSYFPQNYPAWSGTLDWALGLATSLLFFLSVLLHELAHSVVARRRGLAVRDIVLFVFGGVSEITQEPETPATELLMAAVGPLTSIVLGAALTLLRAPVQGLSQQLAAVFLYLGGINLSLGIFNLLPGFPLDGGRVLRAILWWRSRNLDRATRWASLAGQGVAYVFILLGVAQALRGSLAGGLWMAFIGWFLDSAAQTSYRQLAMQRMLKGHTVGEIMTRSCSGISPTSSLQDLVDRQILGEGRRCLPIVDGEAFLGLVTVHRIQGFPRDKWPLITAREAMIPRNELRTISASEELAAALGEMAEDGVNQLPVVEGDRMVGLLTRENVTTFLQLHAK